MSKLLAKYKKKSANSTKYDGCCDVSLQRLSKFHLKILSNYN